MEKGSSRPLVSVVIPFYNRERLLPRAIESVFAQTWKNWEIILVDDGSVDGSFAVASSYAQAHPGRIRVVQQKNGGPGVARNTGVSNARGAFIAMLDSDDQWTPIFMERILAAYDACPDVDWIYVNVRRMNENGNVVIPSAFDDSRGVDFRRLSTRKCAHLNVIVDPAHLETALASTVKEGANTIMRRHVFDRVSYHPTLRYGEDRIFTMLGISAGFRFGYIDEILMTKYHHGENISMIPSDQVDRILASYANRIQGFLYIRDTLTLNRRERAALRLRLSKFYFEAAITMLEAGRGYVEPLPYVFKSVIAEPARNPFMKAVGRRLKKRLHIGSPS